MSGEQRNAYPYIQDARCLKVKPRERAFKQFKSPVLNVLIVLYDHFFPCLIRWILKRGFTSLNNKKCSSALNRWLTVYNCRPIFSQSPSGEGVLDMTFILYFAYPVVFNRREKLIPCFSQSNITGVAQGCESLFFFLLLRTGLEARAKLGDNLLRACASVLLHNQTVYV